jgi:GH25 family lysozyme M1 (1,4-beta-N-acetylmuramidase)
MANSAVGIDISHYQGTIPGGPWLFAVHSVGDGLTYTDPSFAGRYQALRMVAPIVGAYIYARPVQSSGTDQAKRFAVLALAAGFRKGVDIWQLDAEGGENDNISGAVWRTFIDEFMLVATDLLGDRGFLYAGWPFLMSLGLTDLVTHYDWWLPDYGPNDGQIHPVQVSPEIAADVVIHQYTSAGNLDQNVVLNVQKWDAILTPPLDWNILKTIAAYIAAVTQSPMHFGDRGPRITKMNDLLVKHGYNVAGDAYGARSVAAVADFKRRKGLKNRDGKVCGRACILALFKP